MPRKEKKYHYIYKTTNIINNKYYIGMHSTNDLDDGYIGSGKRLWYSVNKHGKENHKTEILEFLPDRKTLKEKESDIINEDLLHDSLCMNITIGGVGGYNKSAVEKLKWLRKNDPIWLENKSKNISAAGKKAYANGRNVVQPPDWTGRKHSGKAKKKMRATHKTNNHQIGKKNSQYGTCWIYSLSKKKSIKIKKEEMECYLLEGWTKGRKIIF